MVVVRVSERVYSTLVTGIFTDEHCKQYVSQHVKLIKFEWNIN